MSKSGKSTGKGKVESSLVSHEPLDADCLEALIAVSEQEHFTKAAKALHVTQSALSQRIQKLEEQVGQALLRRSPKFVATTQAGRKVLHYAYLKRELEKQTLGEISLPGQVSPSPVVRIAAYSSVARSLVVPTLGVLAKKRTGVLFDLKVSEMRLLPEHFAKGECDVVLLDRVEPHLGADHRVLGFEENVLITAKSDFSAERNDVYLDHDVEDPYSRIYLGLDSIESTRRCFLSDVYGLIDGVANGLGRAVVPRHLVLKDPRIRIVRKEKPLFVPVVLHIHRSFENSGVLSNFVDELTRWCRRALPQEPKS